MWRLSYLMFLTLTTMRTLAQRLLLSARPPAKKLGPQTLEEDPSQYRPGGYHPVRVGEMFADRYQVIRKLGFGQYSTVWLAHDARSVFHIYDVPPSLTLLASLNQHVAIKVLTAASYGGENPVYELEILQHIRKANPSHVGYNYVIHLRDHFLHKGPNGKHLCLVFPVMGESVSDLRCRFPNRRIPPALTKQIAQQVLLGLDYLHRSCGVIHTGVWAP